MTSIPLPSSLREVVGRLAPSPTGPMHLGNARTALLAWLSARAQGGTVVLRMEDIDAARVTAAAAAQIPEDFKRLGLDWDAGPEGPGAGGPFVQSQRHGHYAAAQALLDARDHSFPCACSRADIARAASAPHQEDEGPRYPGTCRSEAVEQVRLRARNRGKRVAIRFRSDPRNWCFVDAVRGPLCGTADDFVLWRSDGLPSYQLAVVVDDAAMGVTEVVRGDDLLTSTFRQLALYDALGAPAPAFAHVPLVLAPNGERLAKRNRPVPLGQVLAQGFEPEAIVGALAASAGLCPPGTRARPRDLVASFSWARLVRQAVVIDPATLISYPSRT